jgi:hypothetical protein
MACNGHCNQCALHPGYVGPATPSVWTDDPLETDDEVKATHFNELRSAILDEYTRRSLSPSATPDIKDTDDTVFAIDYRSLRDQIRKADDDLWTAAVSAEYMGYGTLARGLEIQDESTEAFRLQVNTLEAVCVCNCNYSCTCNCNYCTCNCNYSCTCNCNYSVFSDERLKRDIVYL